MKHEEKCLKIIWSLALAVMLLLPSGCMMVGDTGPYCFDSLDCPAGWICDTDSHQCESGDTPDSIIDLELQPGAESSGATTQIPGIDLDDPRVNHEQLELELTPGLALTGHVGSPMGVPGSLVAKRTAEFGGRSLSWNITVDSAGYFEAAVSQGDFEMLFRPTNREDFPQLRLLGLNFADGDPTDSLELTYPTYPTPETLDEQEHILLVKVQVLQSENTPHPISGIQVEGTTDSGLRTNVVIPDAQGIAHLRLPVELRSDLGDKIIYPRTLSITLGPAATGSHLPQVSSLSLALDSPDLGTIYVGDLPDSRAVSGVVTDAQGHAVPDCHLRFMAALGYGNFSHIIASDGQGAFTTTLPEGQYQLTAIPGNLRPEAIMTTELSIEGDTSGVAVMLEARYTLSGTVFDVHGQTASEVNVVADRVGDWTGANDGILRSYETISDGDGHFELAVDPGSYLFSLLPPTASGLPRKPAESLFVYDDEALDPSRTTLREPAVLQGHVFSRVGVPQCGVSIKVFRSNEDSATLVGQGVSAASSPDGCTGAYAIVIPATN